MSIITVSRFLCVLCICLFSFGFAAQSQSPVPKIINGQTATEDYDFFVSLMAKYDFEYGVEGHHWNPFCGASFIGENTIVTAAHCVTNAQTGLLTEKLAGIVIGSESGDMKSEYCEDRPSANGPFCLTANSKDLCIPGYHYTGWVAYTGDESNVINLILNSTNVTVHPKYNPNNFQNDIALIHLPSEITVSKTPINLPSVDEFALLANTGNKGSVRVLGHGDTISDSNRQTSEQSQALLQVDLTPRTDAVCSRSSSTFDSATMICAGDPGLDSCQGDSGGPLFNPLTNTLLGIVSWGGRQCGSYQLNTYGVYTDLYTYVQGSNWIAQNRSVVRSGSVRALQSESLEVLGQSTLNKAGLQTRQAITNGCTGASGDRAPLVQMDESGDYIRMNNTGALGGLSLILMSLLLYRNKDD